MKKSLSKFVDLKEEVTEQSERGIRFRKAPRPTTAKGFNNSKKTSMPPIQRAVNTSQVIPKNELNESKISNPGTNSIFAGGNRYN